MNTAVTTSLIGSVPTLVVLGGLTWTILKDRRGMQSTARVEKRTTAEAVLADRRGLAIEEAARETTMRDGYVALIDELRDEREDMRQERKRLEEKITTLSDFVAQLEGRVGALESDRIAAVADAAEWRTKYTTEVTAHAHTKEQLAAAEATLRATATRRAGDAPAV